MRHSNEASAIGADKLVDAAEISYGKMMKLTLIVLSAVAAVCYARPSGEELPLDGPAGPCPPEDGTKPVYLLDIKNKYAFYECSNGEPHLQYCKGGLVFNPRKDICDYQQAEWEPFGPVGKCPATNPPHPVFLRDGMSMFVFYMCRNGTPKMLKCDGKLIYDPYREACFQY